MEKLIFNGKRYTIAKNEHGRKTLFDESGNDVLSKEIDSWWTEWKLSHKVGFDILRVNKGPVVHNYVVDIDGKLQYLFDKWFFTCYPDDGLSWWLRKRVFVIKDLNGNTNFAILENKKVQYILNIWYNQAWYDLIVTKAFKKPSIIVKLDAYYNLVILDKEKSYYLFENWFDSLCSLEDAIEQELNIKQ